MGTTQPTTKVNKNTNTSCRSRGGKLYSFGACFGLSSPKKQHGKNLYHGPIPSTAAAHDHGHGVESVKYGIKWLKFAKSDVPTLESINEIQIVAATAEAPPPLVHEVNSKPSVDKGIISEENNKQEQSNIPAEISSNPMMIKLRHSVSLPVRPTPAPARLKKAKTAAAAIGEGGNGDEMSAGKVGSMVGASIITLTMVVMLIWGKVCAILCSAAWVLFAHCFRQNNESFEHKNVSDHHRIIPDLDSH